MTKTITVGVSDELTGRMEQLKEVNWSAVTREAIEQYIKQRSSTGLEPAISRIKAMRNDEFRKGYEFVITHSGIELGLAALEEIVNPVDSDLHGQKLFEILGSDSNVVDFLFRYDFDKVDGLRSNVRYIVSSTFVKGMREAAKELVKY